MPTNFKKGDRVVTLEETLSTPKGRVGTVVKTLRDVQAKHGTYKCLVLLDVPNDLMSGWLDYFPDLETYEDHKHRVFAFHPDYIRLINQADAIFVE